jgi:site-specific recombinase XerD
MIMNAFEDVSARYVFPVLNGEHHTEKQQWDRIRKCLKAWNKQLKEVGEILGIKVPITSYVARHTYATTLKRKGVDLAMIGDSMGHKNASTTAVYLKRFADDVLDKANAVLEEA